MDATLAILILTMLRVRSAACTVCYPRRCLFHGFPGLRSVGTCGKAGEIAAILRAAILLLAGLIVREQMA